MAHPKNIYKLKHWFNLCFNYAWYYRPLCSMRLWVNIWFLFHILNINCVTSLSTLGWIQYVFYKRFQHFKTIHDAKHANRLLYFCAFWLQTCKSETIQPLVELGLYFIAYITLYYRHVITNDINWLYTAQYSTYDWILFPFYMHNIAAEIFNKPESFLSYNIRANRFRISRLNQPQIVFDI